MPAPRYSDQGLAATRIMNVPGAAAGAPLLLTPQAGTAAETKTHTQTLDAFGFGTRPVVIKRIGYTVKTAATGTGCSLALDMYNGATSVGSLSVTSEAALAVATSSLIDSTVAAGSYIRFRPKSTTTASDANSAIGFIFVEIEEVFSQ